MVLYLARSTPFNERRIVGVHYFPRFLITIGIGRIGCVPIIPQCYAMYVACANDRGGSAAARR